MLLSRLFHGRQRAQHTDEAENGQPERDLAAAMDDEARTSALRPIFHGKV
jgi:hypothetical protein